jgi:hypothetical protein
MLALSDLLYQLLPVQLDTGKSVLFAVSIALPLLLLLLMLCMPAAPAGDGISACHRCC